MLFYKLIITLNPAQVSIFQAGNYQIMLAKSSSAGGSPNVIWQALPPLPTNVVSWVEQYGLYFTVQQFVLGSDLPLGSSLIVSGSAPAPIVGQALYTLSSNSITGPGASQGAAGTYSLLNSNGNIIVVGLTQAATVNGTPSAQGVPILADTVLPELTDTMNTSAEVYIWVQSAGGLATGGMQVVGGGQMLLPFSSSTPILSVIYNSRTGLFEQSTPPSAPVATA